MAKWLLALLALSWSVPAFAQTTATLPVTCAPGGLCVRATPVANPDGTVVGAGATRGTTSIAAGQVSVGTTAVQVVTARAGRATVTFSVGAANACSFGPAGVTTTTGFALQPVAGASLTLNTAAAVFAICSATTTISNIEQY